MDNLSLNAEDINIEINKTYYVIDALYLNNVKEELVNIDISSIDVEIKNKVFPYTEAPFALIYSNASSFRISQIKIGDEESINDKCFSTDTGLILFIEKSIFIDFLKLFSFDNLIDAEVGVINKSYWGKIHSQFGERQSAAILSPGIKSGLDFQGSGLYEIQQ